MYQSHTKETPLPNKPALDGEQHCKTYPPAIGNKLTKHTTPAHSLQNFRKPRLIRIDDAMHQAYPEEMFAFYARDSRRNSGG